MNMLKKIHASDAQSKKQKDFWHNAVILKFK